MGTQPTHRAADSQASDRADGETATSDLEDADLGHELRAHPAARSAS